MKWIKTTKSNVPPAPGWYWCVFVFVRPFVAAVEWDGDKWRHKEDWTPFYWYDERLPDWPDTKAVFAEVIERVARYIEEEE